MGKYMFCIEDKFKLKNGGSVVVGIICGADMCTGDSIKILHIEGKTKFAKINGIEHNKQRIQRASHGSAVGVWLRDIESEQISIGDIITNDLN